MKTLEKITTGLYKYPVRKKKRSQYTSLWWIKRLGERKEGWKRNLTPIFKRKPSLEKVVRRSFVNKWWIDGDLLGLRSFYFVNMECLCRYGLETWSPFVVTD